MVCRNLTWGLSLIILPWSGLTAFAQSQVINADACFVRIGDVSRIVTTTNKTPPSGTPQKDALLVIVDENAKQLAIAQVYKTAPEQNILFARVFSAPKTCASLKLKGKSVLFLSATQTMSRFVFTPVVSVFVTGENNNSQGLLLQASQSHLTNSLYGAELRLHTPLWERWQPKIGDSAQLFSEFRFRYALQSKTIVDIKNANTKQSVSFSGQQRALNASLGGLWRLEIINISLGGSLDYETFQKKNQLANNTLLATSPVLDLSWDMLRATFYSHYHLTEDSFLYLNIFRSVAMHAKTNPIEPNDPLGKSFENSKTQIAQPWLMGFVSGLDMLVAPSWGTKLEFGYSHFTGYRQTPSGRSQIVYDLTSLNLGVSYNFISSPIVKF